MKCIEVPTQRATAQQDAHDLEVVTKQKESQKEDMEQASPAGEEATSLSQGSGKSSNSFAAAFAVAHQRRDEWQAIWQAAGIDRDVAAPAAVAKSAPE